jgi:methane monooxygenase PmoA-like
VTSCHQSIRFILFSLFCYATLPFCSAADTGPQLSFQRDHQRGELWVEIDGRQAFCYRYGDQFDLPHFFPINSPDGKSMTVQQTQPYPHHRSFWFGDKISLPGERKVEIYSALYTGVKGKDDTYSAPFKDGVRHVRFDGITTDGDTAAVGVELLWYMDLDQPLLDETRKIRVRALGHGEYFIDVKFTVTASYGDVQFSSDDVHYAWPYLRLNSEFAVPGGAKMVADSGPVTEMKSTKVVANWVDYSHAASGKNCGLTMFSHDENAKPHRWLTRDYGTFGPRRIDAKSGKPFTLTRGTSMNRRVGLLIHRGDVDSGQVPQRYTEYIENRL